MACSLLLEPFSKINGGQQIRDSDITHEFVGDQIIYAGLTEFLGTRGTDIPEITNDEEIENAYSLLSVINDVNKSRRFYDSELRWKKCNVIEDKVLKRIGQFHAKRRFGLGNSSNGGNHKVKFADLEQEKLAQSTPTNDADNSQKSKKHKSQ